METDLSYSADIIFLSCSDLAPSYLLPEFGDPNLMSSPAVRVIELDSVINFLRGVKGD